MPETSPTRPALYLDLDDEITAVIDRLGSVAGEEVTLVVPKGAVVLQSAVNLKLLKKAAARYQKKLVVVTRDETGLALAARAGIPTKTHVGGKIIEASQPIKKAPEIPTIHEYGEVKEAAGEPVIREIDQVESAEGATTRATGGSASDGAAPGTAGAVRPSLRAVVEAERIQRQLEREARLRAQQEENLTKKSAGAKAAVSDSGQSLVSKVRTAKSTHDLAKPARTLPPENIRTSREQRRAQPRDDTKDESSSGGGFFGSLLARVKKP